MTVQTMRIGRYGHRINSSRIQKIQVGVVVGARISDRNARVVDIVDIGGHALAIEVFAVGWISRL